MTFALNHKMPEAGNNDVSTDIVWGAEAISRATGETDVRRTYYRLEKGLIPGAGKMGKRHFLSIPAFRRAVHGEAA
ncbi:MAG TPA: DNA-binding protein [Pseudaminobacter sp.]|nr:DNA-binding protein [Pseudaminobacter sp.]